MDDFIFRNLWGVVVGGIGLAVNAGIIYATVKASIAAVSTQVANHTIRINSHAERLGELEKNQAERLGYERAKREFEK